MQKLITKYGLAAHLSLLAVAPLFLFPFCSESAVTVVVLWLSLLAGVWVLMEPSVREGEMTHDARQRVLDSMLRDPLFWVLLAVVAVAAVRALNTGVGLAYDAETAKWQMREAHMPLMPACCGSRGSLPFAAAVGLLVLLQGARHAMGKSARGCFALLSSALAGLSAILVLLANFLGHPSAVALVKGASCGRAFAAIAYGVYFLAGTVALIFVFERKWNKAVLLLPLLIGGTGVGLWTFAAPEAVVLFLAVDLPIVLYSFFFAHRFLRKAGEFKCLVVFGVCLTIAAVAIMGLLPAAAITERMTPIMAGDFLTESFMELRKALGGLSLETWKAHPWLGTGLGSFPIDLRLLATADNWQLIPDGQSQALNGWWQLLVERGIVGALMFALPLGLLLFSYACGVLRGLKARQLPHPACLAGPLALAAVVVLAFVDATVFRPELVSITAALLAVAANSFPKERTNG